MPPKASKQSTSRGRSKSSFVNRTSTKKAKKDTMEEETASQQQLLNQQQVPQPEFSTSNVLPSPELMNTEPISSVDNSSKNKGKNPEISSPPINDNILNEDQSYNASENMLKASKDNKNVLTFERDNDTSLFTLIAPLKNFFLLNLTKKKLTKLVLSSTDCSSRHSLVLR
ncbi:12399_t:CDS:1 [Funneliformis geosporum]|nr:12399_t:CDS:1 [Funneliformis geosporum]